MGSGYRLTRQVNSGNNETRKDSSEYRGTETAADICLDGVVAIVRNYVGGGFSGAGDYFFCGS